VNDIRFALRQLARTPGFAAVRATRVEPITALRQD
jgi:hypothetical protein